MQQCYLITSLHSCEELRERITCSFCSWFYLVQKCLPSCEEFCILLELQKGRKNDGQYWKPARTLTQAYMEKCSGICIDWG